MPRKSQSSSSELEVREASVEIASESISQDVLNKIILTGDISGLTDTDKAKYITALCKLYELDPITRPFDIINNGGAQKLYANRSCTDQIRNNKSLSSEIIDVKVMGQMYMITVRVTGANRFETSTAVMPIGGLGGDELANAMMKCETKAKRRATLAYIGLSIPDETEVETMPHTEAIVNNITEDTKGIWLLRIAAAESREEMGNIWNNLPKDLAESIDITDAIKARLAAIGQLKSQDFDNN